MKVLIKDSYQKMCKWAADYIAAAINAHNENRPFVLGLPTGSTPEGVYAELVKLNKEGKVSFKNVITFNMDEYVGIPENHPESYHSFMAKNLFDHIDIPKSNINILNGNAPDIKSECDNYEKKIRLCGGVDLFLGGVGVDGHIAFNEPGSPLDSRTREQALTRNTIEVNSRFFGYDTEKVPKTALTVGIATVFDAKEVLILANGENKAEAICQMVKGKVSTDWACTALQRHPKTTLVLEPKAASKL